MNDNYTPIFRLIANNLDDAIKLKDWDKVKKIKEEVITLSKDSLKEANKVN